ncbi:hypothetical protein KR222_002604, partial [Zaprionus bogoriensis]
THENICGYRPAPKNFNNWLSPLHKGRLRRFEERELKGGKQPKIIMVHLFADDAERCAPWLEMIYKLAAPDLYGQKIDFFVDDLWAAYVFQWDGFSIHRGDNSFSIESPPLIYGINADREVYFFGNAEGPKTPSLQAIAGFCKELLAGTLVLPAGFEDRLPVQDVDLSSFNDLIYGDEYRDILICFYSGQKQTEDILVKLAQLAAQLQQEQIIIYKMNVATSRPPKNFN